MKFYLIPIRQNQISFCISRIGKKIKLKIIYPFSNLDFIERTNKKKDLTI